VAHPPRNATSFRVAGDERPLGNGFDFVSLVVDGWSISGIKVKEVQGLYRVYWPYSEAKNGAQFTIATPPAAARGQIEAEIITACERASATRWRR
jgi:hypothetical protein